MSDSKTSLSQEQTSTGNSQGRSYTLLHGTADYKIWRPEDVECRPINGSSNLLDRYYGKPANDRPDPDGRREIRRDSDGMSQGARDLKFLAV